jgi:hypothetical protein
VAKEAEVKKNKEMAVRLAAQVSEMTLGKASGLVTSLIDLSPDANSDIASARPTDQPPTTPPRTKMGGESSKIFEKIFFGVPPPRPKLFLDFRLSLSLHFFRRSLPRLLYIV